MQGARPTARSCKASCPIQGSPLQRKIRNRDSGQDQGQSPATAPQRPPPSEVRAAAGHPKCPIYPAGPGVQYGAAAKLRLPRRRCQPVSLSAPGLICPPPGPHEPPTCQGSRTATNPQPLPATGSVAQRGAHSAAASRRSAEIQATPAIQPRGVC
ncbi:hypothetical protein NDU88_006688 [Pleurodeles waltl]|uniref:Uncharacterized protein n=1 Tax=Pleurodeles waltl TaxID=8319 RepID=A0AAV7VMM7_PLEWA|nr:hypothetical protein NDU88_006688 [Pleurodeles waltl]